MVAPPTAPRHVRLRADNKVAFVESGQEDAAEVDRPDPVVDLVEADMMLLEGVGNEEQATLEPEGSRIAIDGFLAETAISGDSKRKVLCDNCARLYEL